MYHKISKNNQNISRCKDLFSNLNNLVQSFQGDGFVVQYKVKIPVSYTHLDVYKRQDKWFVKIESSADQVEFADLLDYSDYKEEIE